MIYLFLGDDLAAKDARIIEIKSQFFKNSQEALSFDFDNLDANKLPDDALQKSFLTLPVVIPVRLIVLRQVHKLKSADIQVLLNFCQKPAKYCDVILESAEKTFKGDLKDLVLYTKTVVFAKPEGPNVFDMTQLITAGRGAEALKMLNLFLTIMCILCRSCLRWCGIGAKKAGFAVQKFSSEGFKLCKRRI